MSRTCVRCGRRQRAGGSFLCDPCRFDPASRREIAHAEGACGVRNGLAQRRYLIARYSWAGGWPNPDREPFLASNG